METNQNLEKTSHNLQSAQRTFNPKLVGALAIVYDRVGIDLKLDDKKLKEHFLKIENALSIAFSDYTEEEIMKGLQNGSLGAYGMPRNFSAVQMCIWVREHVSTLGYRAKKAPKLFDDMNNQEKADYLNDLAMRKITSEGYSKEDAQRVLKDTTKWNVADDFK